MTDEMLRTFIFKLGKEFSYVDGTSETDARTTLVHRRGARWRASSYEGWQGTRDPIPEVPIRFPVLEFVVALSLTGLLVAAYLWHRYAR